MKRLLALMKREFWENKGAFRTTPLVIGGLFLVAMLMFLITFNHFDNEFQSLKELLRFIGGSRRGGEGCVLVVTGRGKRSPNGLSVLREALPRWLSRAPLNSHVLAFCTARRVDGGPGAFYVLLRRAG